MNYVHWVKPHEVNHLTMIGIPGDFLTVEKSADLELKLNNINVSMTQKTPWNIPKAEGFPLCGSALRGGPESLAVKL